jgi:hypothetical protein
LSSCGKESRKQQGDLMFYKSSTKIEKSVYENYFTGKKKKKKGLKNPPANHPNKVDPTVKVATSNMSPNLRASAKHENKKINQVNKKKRVGGKRYLRDFSKVVTETKWLKLVIRSL